MSEGYEARPPDASGPLKIGRPVSGGSTSTLHPPCADISLDNRRAGGLLHDQGSLHVPATPTPYSGDITSEPGTSPRPGGDVEEILSRAFITPRIIDQRSVEDLSATLRTLLRDAATHQKLFAQNTTGIKAIADQAGTLERDLKARLEQTNQASQQFEQRAARAQKLLEAAEQTIVSQVRLGRETAERLLSPDLSSLEARTLSIADSAAAHAQARIDAAVEDAVARTLARIDADVAARCEARVLRAEADFAQRVASLTTLAEATLSQIEHAAALAQSQHERIENLCVQARSLHALFEGQEARTNELAGKLAHEVAAAASRRDELLHAASHTEDRVNAAMARLDTLLADFTSRFERGAGEIEARLAESAQRGSAAAANLSRHADELSAMAAAADINTLRHAVTDAQDALARSTEAALDLREAAAGCARAADDARQVSADLVAARSHAEQAHEAVATLNAMGPRLASLIERGNQIGQGLSRLLARAERAAPTTDPLPESKGQ